MMAGTVGYAYAQAKTRALKSRLLQGDDWRRLSRMGSLDELLLYLRATDYGPFLPAPTAAGTDTRRVALCLHDALIRDYAKLARALPPKGAAVVDGLFLRFAAENVKTLLRGVWQALPAEAIRPLLYRLGQRSGLPVEAMLAADQVPAAVELLKSTVFHAPLVAALGAFGARQSLFPLERAVDLAVFRHLARCTAALGGRDRTRADKLVGAVVDCLNVSWLVRFRWIYDRSPGEMVNDCLPGGGRIPRHGLGELARAADLPAFLETLPLTFRTALEGVQRAEQIQPRLQTWLVGRLNRLFHGDPFHIGLPLAYLLLKELEVKALDGLLSAVGAGETVEVVWRRWQGCWMQTAGQTSRRPGRRGFHVQQ